MRDEIEQQIALACLSLAHEEAGASAQQVIERAEAYLVFVTGRTEDSDAPE